MACLAMHLLIAKKYLEYNNNENESDFIKGTLSPDLATDKIASHFGVAKAPTTVREMLEFKMDIVKASKANKLIDSFERAEFLHLICDDIFYRYVYTPQLEKWNPTDVKQAMYDDFNFVTYYILNNYNIKLPLEIQHLANTSQGKSQFFTTETIDKFVEIISNVNLEQCKNLILTDLAQFRESLISQLNTTQKPQIIVK